MNIEELKASLIKTKEVDIGDKTFQISNLNMKTVKMLMDEAGDTEQLKLVLNNHVKDTDIDLLTLFEAETLALHIRGMSENNLTTDYKCLSCEGVIEAPVDLTQIHTRQRSTPNEFVFESFTVYMRDPVLGELELYNDGSTSSDLVNITTRCIDSIMYDGRMLKDLTVEDKTEILDTLSGEEFMRLVDYIQNPSRPVVMIALNCECGSTDIVPLVGSEEIFDGGRTKVT